jgi:hypothetical protein
MVSEYRTTDCLCSEKRVRSSRWVGESSTEILRIFHVLCYTLAGNRPKALLCPHLTNTSYPHATTTFPFLLSEYQDWHPATNLFNIQVYNYCSVRDCLLLTRFHRGQDGDTTGKPPARNPSGQNRKTLALHAAVMASSPFGNHL